MKKESRINFLSVIILIIIIGLVSWFLYSQEILFDVDAMISFTESFGNFSYIVFFLIVLIEVVAAPIPGAILYTAGGILFGTFTGGTIALLANVCGAAIAFWIGKDFLLNKNQKQEKKKFDKAVDKYGGWAIFFLRINPVTSSDVFSYLAGISKMNFKKFIIGTTLGLLPLIYLQSYFGGEILSNNTTLFNIFIVISILYFVAFIYFIIHKGILKLVRKS